MTSVPPADRYTTPFTWRFRTSKTPKRGEWSIGFSRSLWPRPLPNGMTLYTLRLGKWNIMLEHGR